MVYIIVRYGDCEEELFNPNCRVRLLLQSIRSKCRCKEDDIELSDECGNIKSLREAPNKYANEILEDRETLILLKVEHTNDSSTNYIPLLNDHLSITNEFLACLAAKGGSAIRPHSRRAKSNTRRARDVTREAKVNDKAKPNKLGSAKTDKQRSKSRQGKT